MPTSILGMGTFSKIAGNTTELKSHIINAIKSDTDQVELSNSHCFDDTLDIDISAILGNPKFKRISPMAKFAVISSSEALHRAQLLPVSNPKQVGIFMSTTEGPSHLSNKYWSMLKKGGFKKGNPLLFPETSTNIPVSYVNIAHSITGPTITNTSGFTAASEILDMAIDYLNLGIIKHALVISADEFSDFISWRLNNEITAMNSSKSFDVYSNQDDSYIRAGANCIVLSNDTSLPAHDAEIVSSGFSSFDDTETTLRHSTDSCLSLKSSDYTDIDLIACQNTINEKLKSFIVKMFKTKAAKVPPILSLNSIFGTRFRSDMLQNFISMSIICKNRDILDTVITRETNLSISPFSNADHINILFISLSQTGQCSTHLTRFKVY